MRKPNEVSFFYFFNNNNLLQFFIAFFFYLNLKSNIKNFGDNHIYWKINKKKFWQCFRDLEILTAIENRIDKVVFFCLCFEQFIRLKKNFLYLFKNAANIIKIIMILSDSRIIGDKATINLFQSKPVTLIDVY
jgi:hypothetical protein